MARLFDRPTLGNLQSPAQFVRWADKFLTQIENQVVDLFAALSSMPDIPDVHIPADYTGTVDPALFPVVVQASRYSGETDNTADAAWSFTVDSGALTATIAAGALSITGITATSTVTISSTYRNVTKSRKIVVYLDVANAPSTGSTGGGTSASDTSLANISSAAHAPVSDELTVTVGSSGNVSLSAPLTVSTAATFVGGGGATFKVWGKWQWFNSGTSAWTDVGTEVASNPSCFVSGGGNPTVTNGTLNVSQSKTGLTPGNSEKFRLEARNDSGTRVMTLSGTASAVS